MIKKFLQKVFQKKQKAALDISHVDIGVANAVKTISTKHHKIDQSLISQAALKTCDGLQKAGFEAYIVGGAVRDLLLNVKPKEIGRASCRERV